MVPRGRTRRVLSTRDVIPLKVPEVVWRRFIEFDTKITIKGTNGKYSGES